MKKPICIVLVIALLCGVLAACTLPQDESSETTAPESTEGNPLGDTSAEGTSEDTLTETTDPPEISETEPEAERILREFRENAQNDAEIDWMLAKADPLPEFEITDVDRQRLAAVTQGHALIYWTPYYGKYGEADILIVGKCEYALTPHSTCLSSEKPLELAYVNTVGKFSFCYPAPVNIIAVVEHSVYTLNEAYELGYITDSDLKTIHDYHRREFQLNYPELIEEQVFTEWDSYYPERDTTWIGEPLYNETDLSWMLEEPDPLPELEQPTLAHLRELNTWDPDSYLALNSEYYGTYNGAEVYLCPGVIYEDMCIYVGTACFYDTESFEIYVYKDGKMFSLQEAYYLEEIITDEDLETILGYHHIAFYNQFVKQ